MHFWSNYGIVLCQTNWLAPVWNSAGVFQEERKLSRKKYKMCQFKNLSWVLHTTNSSKVICIACPSKMYGTLTKEHFDDPQSRPLFANLVLPQQQLPSIPFIASKFGNDPGGCLLSYQKKMSSYYVINDFTCCHGKVLSEGLAIMC